MKLKLKNLNFKKKNLIIFFIFLYISIFLNSVIDKLFIFTDTNIGFQSIYSISMITPFILFLVSILMLIFSGVKFIPEKTANEPFKGKKILGNMIILSVAISLFLILLIEIFNGSIGYFGASYNMLDVLRSYIPLYSTNIVFFSVILVLQIVLVTNNDFKRYLFSFCLNIILRVLFELVFVVLLNFSTIGLFLSILFSNIFTLFILIQKFISKKYNYKLTLKDFSPNVKDIFKILKGGISSFLISIVISIVITLLIIDIKNYDYDLLLGNSNILYFILFAIFFKMIGIIIGTHFISENDNISKKKLIILNSVVLVFSLLFIVSITYIFNAKNLTNMVKAPEVLDVIKMLLNEYSSKLIILSIIAIVNIIYILIARRKAIVLNILKFVIIILPIYFVYQPFCLASGIGYSSTITDFFNGNSVNAYEYFGAHLMKQNGEDGCMFRVYAPNAADVTLICNKDDWQLFPMSRDENGIYSLFKPGVNENIEYKYKITTKSGEELYKADPYCYKMNLYHNNSIVADLEKYKFSDDDWMKNRSTNLNKPMSVYELHLGSWRRHEDNSPYTYTELKKELIPYLKQHGYTHIEFLPINETVLYESWGYLPGAYFSVTTRYGSIEELKDFINELHKNNIGVFFDLVGYHYMNQKDGIANFDGTELYGFEDSRLSSTAYSSLKLNHNKNIVRSFLFSNLNYWLGEYHFDGVRVDAVCETMFWDREGQSKQRSAGFKFIKDLNSETRLLYPNVFSIAEDASSLSYISTDVKKGGMGFDFKWDMGWSYDTLEFLSSDQDQRRENYNNIPFSMRYFFKVNSMITISHDDANPASQSGITDNVIKRMWGSYEDQLRQGRLLYTHMFMHPGKKLMFMGSEFAQYNVWDCQKGLDWNLLGNEKNAKFLNCIDSLNKLYASNEALYKDEYNASNFSWLDVKQTDKLVYVCERSYNDKHVVIALNFSNNDYNDFKIEYSKDIKLKEIFNSDDINYGGNTVTNSNLLSPTNNDSKYEFTVKLPKFSGVVYEVVRE